MKMSDHRLKRILQENPVPVQPKKKEELLAFARKCDENPQDMEDAFTMKYLRTKKLRTLIAAAAILTLMASAVTAGIVHHYYHTPGGNIVNEQGMIVTEAENIALKMTGEALSGIGYTIEEVNWLSYNGQSTFTVWLTADSEEPQNLRAVINTVEYPLTKSFVTKDRDGKPLCIAYTTTNLPEPQNWSPDTMEGNVWICCDAPFMSHSLFFEPTDIAPVHTTASGITLTGYLHGGNMYLGAEDNVLNRSTLRPLISNTSSSFTLPVLTDTSGTVHDPKLLRGTAYGVGDGGIADTCYPILEGITPASLTVNNFLVYITLSEVENVTCCDLPIPEEGETLTGEWKVFDAAGIRITITEITRDKYSISYYSPDAPANLMCYRGSGGSDFDTDLFADSITQIQLGVTFGNLTGTGLRGTRVSPQPVRGRKWRVASETLDEYCETHDSVRLKVHQLYLSYSGDWTLTFPEN